MKRRNFVTTIMAGVLALPLVGKGDTKHESTKPSEPESKPEGNCNCTLIHKESYSGIRCIDARITSDTCPQHPNG